MVRFRIKDKDKYYNLPTKVSELDTKTFLRLQEVAQKESTDEIDLACALCDAERIDFINLSGKDLKLIQEATAFVFQIVPTFSDNKSNSFTRNTGEKIVINVDFEKMQFGQRVEINSIIKRYKEDNPSLVIAIIAVLLAPYIYPHDDWTKELTAIEEEIKITPAEVCIPFFNFFLSNSFSLKNTIKAWLYSQKILFHSKRKAKN